MVVVVTGMGKTLHHSPRNAESFQIKRGAFRLVPPDGGLLVFMQIWLSTLANDWYLPGFLISVVAIYSYIFSGNIPFDYRRCYWVSVLKCAILATIKYHHIFRAGHLATTLVALSSFHCSEIVCSLVLPVTHGPPVGPMSQVNQQIPSCYCAATRPCHLKESHEPCLRYFCPR